MEGARCCEIGESVERNGSLLPLARASTLKSRKELEPYEDDMGAWWEWALSLSWEWSSWIAIPKLFWLRVKVCSVTVVVVVLPIAGMLTFLIPLSCGDPCGASFAIRKLACIEDECKRECRVLDREAL